MPAIAPAQPTNPKLTQPHPIVGASLLAKAADQSPRYQLCKPIREQARSHRLCSVQLLQRPNHLPINLHPLRRLPAQPNLQPQRILPPIPTQLSPALIHLPNPHLQIPHIS